VPGLLVLAVSVAQAWASTQTYSPIQDQVQRGLVVRVRTSGTVRADETLQLDSTIEGRVERVFAVPMTWVQRRKPIAHILEKDLAAMTDANTTTPNPVLQERWDSVYQPSPVTCPWDCFILKVFAKEKSWIRPNTVMFEVARRIRLVGRIRAQGSLWVRKGQVVVFWDRQDPDRKFRTRVEDFSPDIEGSHTDSGGTLTALLDEDGTLRPGTAWEGFVLAPLKKNSLQVPTEALIEHHGEVYLPVRVSTGITTYDMTEVTDGVSEGQGILILPDRGRAGAGRFTPPSVQRPQPALPRSEPPQSASREEQPVEKKRPVAAEEEEPVRPRARGAEDRRRRKKEQLVEPLPLETHPSPEEKPYELNQDFPSDAGDGGTDE
jgi:hypothetical protein